MGELVAFPLSPRIPAVGDAVRLDGLRCIVQRHAHRWGWPTGLLLRLLEGPRAGSVVVADCATIEIIPAAPAGIDPTPGETAPRSTER